MNHFFVLYCLQAEAKLEVKEEVKKEEVGEVNLKTKGGAGVEKVLWIQNENLTNVSI